MVTMTTADVAAALIALQSDPYVSMAVEPPPVQPSSVELLNFGIDPDTLPPGGQYGRTDLNIDAAWQLAGGYALIAQIDTGLYTARPALTQFSNPGGMYLGGNFIPAASLDIGLTGIYPNADSPNVDEERVEPVPPPCAVVPSVNAGHGTHVAGLIVANGGSGQGVQGTCKHCGIAMWRAGYSECVNTTPPQVEMGFNSNASDRGQAQAIDTGAQVLNLSFGASSEYVGTTYCIAYVNTASCLDLSYAKSRDVAPVASSGKIESICSFRPAIRA